LRQLREQIAGKSTLCVKTCPSHLPIHRERRSGCTTCSASACGMASCFWPSEALSLPMRPSGDGAGNSAGHSQTAAPPPARRQMVPRRDVHPDPGVQHYLWRVVDQHGAVLDVLVQPRRDAKAAKGFFRRLLKACQYDPRVIVTDKLRSYAVAQRQLLPRGEHRRSRYSNNRAANPHRPTRRRERQVQRFNHLSRLTTFSPLTRSSVATSARYDTD
jgi:hypothetical protein